MNEKDFQTQVIKALNAITSKLDHLENKLDHVENKLIEHDSQFSKIDSKLDTITEQTAHNSELEYTMNQNKDSIEKLEFEVELIKKYLRT